MKNKLFNLDYFKDKQRFPNQKLITDTINYFENGAGKEFFSPIEFFNLFYKEYQYVLSNIVTPQVVLEHLKALPISDRELHILMGFILKWTGGYPVNNLDEDCNNTLKLIETEFLSFSEDTPEKEYCRVDSEQIKYLNKLGIVFNAKLKNPDINVEELWKKLPKTKYDKDTECFTSFNQLFLASINKGLIDKPENPKTYQFDLAALECSHNFSFNVWLQETRHWNGSTDEYDNFLKMSLFEEYLNESIKKKQEIRKGLLYTLLFDAYETIKNTTELIIKSHLKEAEFLGIDKDESLKKLYSEHRDSILKSDYILNSTIRTYKSTVYDMLPEENKTVETYIDFLATILSSFEYIIVEDKLEKEDEISEEFKNTFLSFEIIETLNSKKNNRKTDYTQSEKKTIAPISLNELFERFFNFTNFPYKSIIEKNLLYKKELFNEFKEAPLKPSFDLYLRQYYTDEEYTLGIEDANNRIPVSKSNVPVAASFISLTPFESHINELRTSFYEGIANKTLPKDCYVPNIEATPIVITLKKIDNTFELLLKSPIEREMQNTALWAESILQSINELKNQNLRISILTYLVSENENIYILIEKNCSQSINDKWKAIKEEFNTILRRHIQSNNENQKENNLIENDVEKENNQRTKKFICESINSVSSDQQWEYAFKKEADYQQFVELLVRFFNNQQYNIPPEGIKLNKGCKTKLAPVFNTIHKELSENQLKSDSSYFDLIKTLNHFAKMTNDELYKAITR